MTRVLALDCALGACSVALIQDTHVLAHEHLSLERGHAEALLPMVDTVLTAADCAYGEISVVAATVGPGSFTGVRIGLAAARGLALAIPTETVAVTTLEAIAAVAAPAVASVVEDPELQDRSLLVALDTKRGDLYAQWFDLRGRPAGEPHVSTATALLEAAPSAGILVAGDAVDDVVEVAAGTSLRVTALGAARVPDARVVARLAAERFADVGGSPLLPVYLRSPEVGPPARR